MSGSIDQSTCESSNGNNNGCGITSDSSSSYGTGLNSAQGAVYATEVTSSTITIWFWSRGSEPSDVTSGSPDPSNWGTPFALFSGCDISSYFKDMQIVFDTTFCGDWAGQAWSSDSQCSSKASTCEDYVQNNPDGFSEAYWAVNSLKVYSGSGSGSGSSSGSTSSPATATPMQTSQVRAAAAQPSWGTQSWGAWGGHGGRGRPTDTAGSPFGAPAKMHRRHAGAHAH